MDRDILRLYLVTDSSMCADLARAVEQAILGGVTVVQLREKGMAKDELIARGRVIKEICHKHGVPLIINDSVDIALALNADGVHLGAGDGDIAEARVRLGEDKIIGASCRTVEMAKRSESDGADYLGVGAVFGTSTKSDAKTISPAILSEIASSVSIPTVAIGGVNADNIYRLSGTGISGVAVISAILRADSIIDASRNIRSAIDKVIK